MELINIQEKDGKQLVSARELYDFLELDKSNWSRWSKKNIIDDEFFTESEDYQGFVTMTNGNETKDYVLNIEMAKELSMLCRTAKGKEARKYFIKCEEAWNSPEMILSRANQIQARMLETYKDKVEVLEVKIKEDAHRVSFAETIEKASDCILIRDMSKILSNEGIKLGERKLYNWLRNKGLIMKNSTKPTQKAVDMGLFHVDERVIKTVAGDKISLTTKITGKGQLYILQKFKE